MTGHRIRALAVQVNRRGTRWMSPESIRVVRATCCAAAALLLSVPMVVAADLTAADESILIGSSVFVCLSNTVKDETERGQSFVIAVPSKRAGQFVARGYERASCAGIKVLDRESRQGICEAARAADPAVNLYFWQRYSFTPEEICNVIGAARSAATDAS